jgi:thioredoxin-related protein
MSIRTHSALVAGLALAGLVSALPPAAAQADAPTFGAVDWFRGPFFSVKGKAQAEQKNILLVFWSEGFPWSEKLGSETLTDPAALDALDAFICVQADLTRDAGGVLRVRSNEKLAQAFPVQTFPTMFVVRPDGKRDDIIAGFIPAPQLVAELARIQAGDRTLTDLENKSAADPEDLQARFDLAGKLYDVGFVTRSQEERDFIQLRDPDRQSLPLRREDMSMLQERMFREFQANGVFDFELLPDFLGKEPHDIVRYEGWSYMASVYTQFNKPKEARGAHRKAWKTVPEDSILIYGEQVAGEFWTARADLTAREKIFALTVAKLAASKAESLGDPTADNDGNSYPSTNYDAFLASYLDLLACCHAMNDEHETATALLARCRQLDPQNAAYEQRVAELRPR